MRPRLVAIVLLVAAAGWALDRLTKRWALAALPGHPRRYLGGFLRFVLVHNPGAAFSLGTSVTIAFTVLAVVAALVVLVVVVPRLRRSSRAVVTGVALAGITGNLTDRLTRPPAPWRGYVVDFISLPHFAIFNVADIFITCTAALLLVFSLIDSRREAAAESNASQGEAAPTEDAEAPGDDLEEDRS